MRKLITILAFGTIASGLLSVPDAHAQRETCTDDDYREVNVNGLYSMQIPNHMNEDTTLNDEASLEYADPTAELYIIVIDESLKDFVETFKGTEDYNNSKTPLENYAILQRETCAGILTTINELSGLSPGKYNGLNTYTFTMRGYVDGIEPQIYYKVRCIQGETTLYIAMTWTIASDRKDYNDEMTKMLDSFREL